ncbi:MAG: Rrf2 family transcriptional regulator [Verrucomicrobiae bacterium]|nr:Rrf2 family transcriptional regulator [Verrucomicrobiae bacterium]
MKLSTKSDYAARAVLSLARSYGRRAATPVEEIAQENGAPPNYLVQILIELKSGGIVRSVRGKAGGYVLARPPAAISFADVLRCIHGTLLDSPAFRDDQCPAELRDAWMRLRNAVQQEAEHINFQQLAEAGDDPARMFYI